MGVTLSKRLSRVRLHVIPAKSSPLALVIRRGPSKWWHFLTWDRETGDVYPGSWFNGMIYPHRCDFSPKGDWMVILAYRGHQTPYAWTAVCRPPSVRAHVFIPQDSVAFGGGFFDERLPILWINHVAGFRELEENQDIPFEFGFMENNQKPFFGLPPEQLARQGWKTVKSTKADLPPNGGSSIELLRWHKPSPDRNFDLELFWQGGKKELAHDPSEFRYPRLHYRLANSKNPAEFFHLEGVEWADWNRKGELCLATQGQLFIANPGEPSTQWRLVANLNEMTPRQQVPHFNNLYQHAAY